MVSGEGCFNDTFPTLLTICENEKIEIRHESWGCFHHYEDVFEISGEAPLNVVVYRQHPSGATAELDLVEEKGTVALTDSDVNEANGFIAHTLAIGSQKDAPIPNVVSTTDDILRLVWYRDGEIVDAVCVQDYQATYPFLNRLRSRTDVT
jgi:hypothetical protein